MRNKLADAVMLDLHTIARSAQDFDVAATELRGLQDRLSAPSAWSYAGSAGELLA
jgi:hypothetical protein